jgi:N-methylhydantoinase B
VHGLPTLPVDPIRRELLRSRLAATVADMGQVLCRNAISTEIVEEHDYANGIVLDRGAVVMLDNVLHLGAASATAASMQELFQFAMKPGDIILSNDPYSGGTHVQDFTLLSPFYYEREQICYLLCRAHLPDIGGQVPGGFYPFADDVWGEGSRIPPLKVVKEGKIVADKLDAVVINSRFPNAFRVNLQAMFAAVETGRLRLHAALQKLGKRLVSDGLPEFIKASQSQLKAEMAGWPRGSYEGASQIDHDCKGGKNLEVRATLHIGKKVVLDFSSSSPQSAGFVNSTRANTVGFALVPFYAILRGAGAINSALLHAVEIVTKEGSVVHPRFPAAVGWGPVHVGAEIVSAVGQALGQAFPDVAAVLSRKSVMARVRWGTEDEAIPLHTFLQGGSAASNGADGWGSPAPFARAVVPSVEMLEGHAPVRLRKLELLPDSAGSGQWRGAPGTVAEFEFTEPVRLDTVVEGQVHTNEATAGGKPGQPNAVEVVGDAYVQGLAWDHPVSSQSVIIRLGGGGGWGDPAHRDPAAVAEDLDNELISSAPMGQAAPHSVMAPQKE